MSIRTTLIYPGIAGLGFNSLKLGMEAGWISHGLASLSSAAKAEGFEVDLIDLRALSGWDHFREVLAERDPDVIGVTMMSVDYNPAFKAISIAAEVKPELVTIIGGPHVTIALMDSLRIPHVDYLVTGEGEVTFPKLLHAIEKGEPPSSRVLRGEPPDLDAIPFTDRSLFLDEWRKWGYDLDSPEVPFVEELPPPFVTIIAGRGCLYHCAFCKPGEDYLFGKRTRRRSVDNVIEEIRHLVDEYHIASFMFHDDCLTEDREWVMEFTDKYIAEGFTMPFFCQSRADIIVKHEDMVERMAEAGLKGYFIGFESGNDRVLKFIRKGTTVEQNRQAARICRKYGISIWANYMMGLPTETREEVLDTVRLMKEIDPDYYSPAFFTPHPGTDLYDYVVEHDLSRITDYDSYRRNPTEPKIKGQDYEFLKWAMAERQRRKPINAFRRWTRRQWRRARRVTPAKVARKLGLTRSTA
ncbi:MAG TPA: B12-binding domain-containing radical SAM protein [Chloroflexi bacterium]|nr:B12-binding domain-containing radical SAM protein [Chloroflexota bacterium]